MNKRSVNRNTRLRLIQEEYSSIVNKRISWEDFQDISYSKDYNLEQYDLIKIALEENRKKIDRLIAKYSKERPFEQLNPIDVAILRVIIAELFFARLANYKVLIDEAVEIAKKYSTPNSYKYINGVLGAILRNDFPELLTD